MSLQERSRIDATTVDGQVVVRVKGSQLFDLVDDQLIEALEEPIVSGLLFRIPGANDFAGGWHEVIFPVGVRLELIQGILAKLPAEEVRLAELADAAT